MILKIVSIYDAWKKQCEDKQFLLYLKEHLNDSGEVSINFLNLIH